jgi:hypothetical protein
MTEKEEYKYNRIILIGNGYDLALGLKTSYADFLFHLVRKVISKPTDDLSVSCPLFTLKLFQSKTTKEEFIQGALEKNDIMELSGYMADMGRFQSRSRIWNASLIEINKKNWVDIESLYFRLLLQSVKQIDKDDVSKRDIDPINRLNKVFKYLHKELAEYILFIDDSIPLDPYSNSEFETFNFGLVRKLSDVEFEILHDGLEPIELSELLFLNFNYTRTLRKVLTPILNGRHYRTLNIHGTVGEEDNKTIFGYGDDIHPMYKELENEDEHAILEHIKAFHYSRTRDYHFLLSFISSRKYEVYIVGHSCGLSDRTLLQTLFENDNCLGIKIFHRGDYESHFRKNIAISRHFSDKPNLRRKVLPFDADARIPQTNISKT